MGIRLTGRELYRRGMFNACSILPQPDGSAVYMCGGERAPAPFLFQVRGLDTDQEVVIFDAEVSPGAAPWRMGD